MSILLAFVLIQVALGVSLALWFGYLAWRGPRQPRMRPVPPTWSAGD
ncbi:hypothetical protein [Deinococcus sedimenti]|nr:hypothetical protein [Deinococcus sedimenti]